MEPKIDIMIDPKLKGSHFENIKVRGKTKFHHSIFIIYKILSIIV